VVLFLALSAVHAANHGAFASHANSNSLASKAAFLFRQFQVQYEKRYSPAEEKRRFSIFQANMQRADELNHAHRGRTEFGVTQFADLSPEEFRERYLGLRLNPQMQEELDLAPSLPLYEPADIPTAWNWISENATTPIYNQGECGSCWAFSVAEQVESMWYLKHRNDSKDPPAIRQLSMQQIVDCDTGDGDEGCDGGDPRLAYEYVQKTGGLDSLSSYPYQGYDGTCAFKKANIEGDVNGWTYVTPNTSKNETQMLYYVAQTGPIAICADASSWQLYIHGVIRFMCGSNLDHAIQLVGYGSEDDFIFGHTNYWIIRNSWGELWGEHGCLRVERGKDLCGVADIATTVSISD